jgi:hypothetical protein
LIDSHFYCFKDENEERSSVGVDYLNGEEPEWLAESVAQSFEILNNDAARLKCLSSALTRRCIQQALGADSPVSGLYS